MTEKQRQEDRLLEALRTGPVDPMKAWRELGIYRLGARVFDLKEKGHDIQNKGKTISNRFGERCRVANYHLIQEAGA